jgi:hypothetical protein
MKKVVTIVVTFFNGFATKKVTTIGGFVVTFFGDFATKKA